MLVYRNMNRQLSLGFLACFWLGLAVVPTSADEGARKKETAAPSQKNNGFSTDNLQKQISDLDGQIQKLRKESLELQEKVRAKLQAQLDGLKKQRDTLIPRIKKLRDDSEMAWQDIKENIQTAIEDLKASVDTMGK